MFCCPIERHEPTSKSDPIPILSKFNYLGSLNQMRFKIVYLYIYICVCEILSQSDEPHTFNSYIVIVFYQRIIKFIHVHNLYLAAQPNKIESNNFSTRH